MFVFFSFYEMIWAKGACLNVNQAWPRLVEDFQFCRSPPLLVGDMPKIHLKSIMITFNIQILPSIMQIQVATNLKEGYYKQRNIVMSPYFLGFVHRKMSYLLKTILSDTRKTLWERQPCFFSCVFSNKLKITPYST